MRTFKAFPASWMKSLIVAFAYTFLSTMVRFPPIPLLSYRSPAKPLSERYLDICKSGWVGGGLFLRTNPRVSFLSVGPVPWIRRTPGNGPFPTAGKSSWALVFIPFPKSMSKFLYFIVWMYCSASAWSCCLKILVDKQDNASIAYQ